MRDRRHGSVIASVALVGLAGGAKLIANYLNEPRFAPPKARTERHFSTDDLPAKPAGRASEGSRGRHATAPWQIPWTGWKDILRRTYEQINEDRLLAVAAGVVFYALLALFPAITALVSFYGLFAKSNTISDHLSMAAGILPAGAFSVVQDQVGRVLAKGDIKLGFAFLFSVALALWSANGGMKAIIDALNIVYDEKEKRGFFKLNVVSLLFTLGAVVGLLIAVGFVIAVPIVLATIGLGGFSETLLNVGRWPFLVITILLGLAVLYRFGPSRRAPRWQWISVGSLLAATTWIAGSAALSFYLANYANYDATYGSLGAAIGLMVWMWMTTIVILFGAELNSEIEHQTAQDTTQGREKPPGARGATMADSIGDAKVSG